MRVGFFVLAAVVLGALFSGPAAAAAPGQATTPAKPIVAAISDPARVADQADDAARKPLAILRFSDVKPGDVVVEFSPGSGYWTRLFSQIVGPEGHVYTIWPTEMAKYSAESMAKWQKLIKEGHYANVTVLSQPLAEFAVPKKADLVFTSQNYHDFHNLGIDMVAFDKRIFDELKPGGKFMVIDHQAPPGSGFEDTKTLHRIESIAVQKEVVKAGFEYDGTSHALFNGDDPLDVGVFDKSVRGHTNQFILRFKKPHHGVIIIPPPGIDLDKGKTD